jgi:hypothetical protein
MLPGHPQVGEVTILVRQIREELERIAAGSIDDAVEK